MKTTKKEINKNIIVTRKGFSDWHFYYECTRGKFEKCYDDLSFLPNDLNIDGERRERGNTKKEFIDFIYDIVNN